MIPGWAEIGYLTSHYCSAFSGLQSNWRWYLIRRVVIMLAKINVLHIVDNFAMFATDLPVKITLKLMLKLSLT